MTREPFLTALTRNALLAVLLGVVFLVTLPRSDTLAWDYVDVFTLAFCFAFLGYYVEVLLLKVPGIDTGAGRLVRMLGWFAGGLWCYVVGRYLWILYGRHVAELPGLIWGGVFFVALQLLLHAGLDRRGVPNFYRQRPRPPC
ncbi:MAG: hypothetical protein ACREL9_11825 [Gemmatimonadales bacterium]